MKNGNIKLTVYFTEENGKRVRVPQSHKNNGGVKMAELALNYVAPTTLAEVQNMDGYSEEALCATIERQRLYHGAQSQCVNDFLTGKYSEEKKYILSFAGQERSGNTSVSRDIRTFYKQAEASMGKLGKAERLQKYKALTKEYPDCPECPEKLEASAWVAAYHLLVRSRALNLDI